MGYREALQIMARCTCVIWLLILLLGGAVFSQEETVDRPASRDTDPGRLVVKAALNGEPITPAREVRYWIFPKGRPNDLVESALIISPKGEEVAVSEEIYTVKVRYMDVLGKPFREKKDIYVPSGERVEAAFDLETGKFQITAASQEGMLLGFRHVKVWIYEHPEKVEYGYYGSILDHEGLLLECEPGIYDIKVEYSSAAARPAILDEMIRLSAGDRLSKHFYFPQGEIILRVKDSLGQAAAGRPRIRYWIFEYPSGPEVAYGKVERMEGHSIFLPPGIYNIKVQYSGVAGNPVKWLSRIELGEDETVIENIQFTATKLRLRAEAFGRALSGWRQVTCAVMEAGSDQEVFYGTLEPGKDEISIKEGTYDIKFQFAASENKEVIWVRRVDLKDGETGEAGVEFSAGHFEVEVFAGNKPLHGWKEVRLWIAMMPSGEEIHEGTLKKGPYKNRFVLTEGNYLLKVQYIAGDFSPVKEVPDIIIRNMETTKIRVDFP